MADMAIRPSIQALLDQLEQLRAKTDQLVSDRGDQLRQLAELASEKTELVARLEHERAKFKKRGWSV
jgi:hypothetical protein